MPLSIDHRLNDWRSVTLMVWDYAEANPFSDSGGERTEKRKVKTRRRGKTKILSPFRSGADSCQGSCPRSNREARYSYFLTVWVFMLAKKTVKNQITLPKAVASRFQDVEYFEISADDEVIMLRPLRRSRADEVRAKLAKLGVRESDVAKAVAWARKRR